MQLLNSMRSGLENLINEHTGYIDLASGEFVGNIRLQPFAQGAHRLYTSIQKELGESLEHYLMDEYRYALKDGEIANPDKHLVGVMDLARRTGGLAAAVNIYLDAYNPFTQQKEDWNITALDSLQLLAYGEEHPMNYINMLHETIHAMGVDTEMAYEITTNFLFDQVGKAANEKDQGRYLGLANMALQLQKSYESKQPLSDKIAIAKRKMKGLPKVLQRYMPKAPAYQPV